MISGFVQGGCFDKALEMFREMKAENVKPNAVTMVGVLSACTKLNDLEFGRWIRSYIEQNGIKMDLTLSNAMLDMYVKCGSVEDAKILFDKMEEKDIVSLTTMIDEYAKLGEEIYEFKPKSARLNSQSKVAVASRGELRVREAFKTKEVVRLDCSHAGINDCKKIGVKLRDLVPCVPFLRMSNYTLEGKEGPGTRLSDGSSNKSIDASMADELVFLDSVMDPATSPRRTSNKFSPMRIAFPVLLTSCCSSQTLFTFLLQLK
ncbi:hypothetical protein LWI29_017368 [Acer saccharum]|uniref:Pentatricopeptide repeat-containing protein n=1 Tax=Acer saccharum TaxID=4024 RepID=A0AA39V9H7_ACESA|nr:hypothetical protein LWI29_017368 [Acer saccharum]